MTGGGPDFGRMRERLLEEVDRRRVRRRLRNKWIAAGVGAALLAATTGAVWVALASPERRDNTASCYERASLSAPNRLVGDPSPQGSDRVERAVDLCASLWRGGFIGHGTETAPPNDGRIRPVPSLFACQQPNGTLAVFPGTGREPSCQSFGLGNP